jgi:hypothetical protein
MPVTPQPWRATAHESRTRNPNSVQDPCSLPDGPWRETTPCLQREGHRIDVAQGTNVTHGLAEVPLYLDARRHKTMTGARRSRVRTALTPVAQRGSGATSPGSASNAGRAAQVNRGCGGEIWGGGSVSSM